MQSQRTPFHAVSVNCLYRDRVRVGVRDRVSGRVTDTVRVGHPDSSGNLLIRRKMEFARTALFLPASITTLPGFRSS